MMTLACLKICTRAPVQWQYQPSSVGFSAKVHQKQSLDFLNVLSWGSPQELHQTAKLLPVQRHVPPLLIHSLVVRHCTKLGVLTKGLLDGLKKPSPKRGQRALTTGLRRRNISRVWCTDVGMVSRPGGGGIGCGGW